MADSENTKTNIAFPTSYLTKKYKFMRDSLNGSGGFMDGGYVVPFSAEHPKDYQYRQYESFYPGLISPIIMSYRDPIFAKTPTVSGTLLKNQLWASFSDRVNGSGKSLFQFMKRACMMTKLQSATFIVLEPPMKSGKTNADNIREGNLPILRLVNPDDVEDYELDADYNLKLFEYRRKTSYGKNVTNDEVVRFESGVWSFGGSEMIPISKDIPVIPYYADENEENKFIPDPSMYSMCRLNHRIYNQFSQITNLERKQCSSLLVVPGNDNGGSVRVGAGGAIREPSELNGSRGIRYEAPDASQLTTIYDGSDRLKRLLYQMARLGHLHTGESLAISGEAKKMDNMVTSQAISSLAVNTESVQIKIGKLFAEFIGKKELANDYNVSYPKEYTISDVESKLENAIMGRELSFGITGTTKVRQDAYWAQGISATEEEKKIINDEIAEEVLKEYQAKSVNSIFDDEPDQNIEDGKE